MKKLLLLLFVAAFQFQATAVVDVNKHWSSDVEQVQDFSSVASDMSVEEFLAMTPKSYKAKTGKKLGLKKALQLKMAKRAIKKQQRKAGGGGISKGLYIVLALFGLAWIAMGIADGWSGKTWWSNLLWTLLLTMVAGLIHALVKMKNYY